MNNIQDLPLFAGLNARALAALAESAQQVVLAKGETLFEQGDDATAFYIVTRGGVRLVEHTPEGKALNLKVYGPGDTFGLLAVTGGYAHNAAVIAAGPSVLYSFNGAAMRDLISRHPSVGLRIIDALVDHVHHAHDRIRQMAVEKTERRLARALLHFSAKFGQSVGPGQVSTNVTQREIAEFTGTTTETVSRLFKSWERAGYIQCDRSSITVLAADGLRQVIADEAERGMGYHLL